MKTISQSELEQLAEVITPEQLHWLNAAVERKALTRPAAGMPIQEGQKSTKRKK